MVSWVLVWQYKASVLPLFHFQSLRYKITLLYFIVIVSSIGTNVSRLDGLFVCRSLTASSNSRISTWMMDDVLAASAVLSDQ